MKLSDYFNVKDSNTRDSKNSCGEGYIRIKVIKKMLRLHVDCTPEGRKICKGKCCNNASAIYEQTELWKLPEDLRKILIPTYDAKPSYMKGRLVYVAPIIPGYGCALRDVCMKNPEIKPFICWLSPLRIVKRGDEYRLEFSHEKMLHCPMFGKGDEAWKVLKNDIIKALGEDGYRQIEEGMKKPGDEPFYICVKKWF